MIKVSIWRRAGVALALAAILAFGMFSAGLGTAQAAPLVNEKAQFNFAATEAAPGASGVGKLELLVEANGQKQLLGQATLSGMPMVGRFSLCVDGALLDDENADKNGKVALSGKLENQEVTVATLDGLAVTVRLGIGCTGTVLLRHVVSGAASPSGVEVRFKAMVVSISEDLWHIGDFMIQVDANTRMIGDPGVGSGVEVRAQAQPDGSALAMEIKNLSPAAATSTGPIFPGPASGPGYGVPLTVSVPSTQLLLDRVGEVKAQPGQVEVKDRQYEGIGSLPVTINDTSFTANEIKVISNLRVKGGVGQHQGTVDIDIDTVPGGHLTLEYKGSATLSGGTIVSGGTFKVVKATDIFALIRSEGTYVMTIVESGSTLGSPATVTFFASGQ